MFADFPILSRESIYTTNFMKYGFTPGMGATFILPRKLGITLAEEMMIVARTYRGEELQRRGVPFPVLPRAEVAAYAFDLAKDIAEKPRISLVTLKDHLVASLRTGLARDHRPGARNARPDFPPARDPGSYRISLRALARPHLSNH